MKHILFTIVSLFSSIVLIAQIRTADDVERTFSPRNLMTNHIENLSNQLKKIGLDNLSGDIEKVVVTYNNKSCDCQYANGQIASVVCEGKNSVKFVYNSDNKLEIVQIENNQIIATTYDKKGRVASEASLKPYQSKGNTSVASAKAKTMMAGDYIYTDLWKNQTVTDTTAQIYLYEVLENGSTQEWAIERLYVYNYKSNGLMKERIEKASNPSRDAVYDFSYKHGLLEQQVKTYTNSNMVEGSTYYYENGKLIKVNKGYFKAAKGKNPPLISSETSTMTYDSTGKLLQFTSTDGYRNDSCFIQRDDKQRIVYVQKTQENGEMIPMFQCEYDDHNFIVKGEPKQQFARYEYDEKDNWIKQSFESKNGDVFEVKREIQYKK